MTSHTTLTFIIVNYNGEKYLNNLLDSISNQTYFDYSIVIVDNNSNDQSIKIIKSHSLYPNNKIKLFSLNKNTGFALGNYIALINNDVILDKYWAEEMINLAESKTKTGIITSKVFFAKKRNIINSAGVLLDEASMPYNRGMFEVDRQQFQNIEETEAFYGAAGFIKRKVIETVGYFNRNYFMYQEEYDLSVRSKNQGWKILYNPFAVVYHFHSASAGKYTPKKTYYSIRNYVCNTYKYLTIIKRLKAHKNFFIKVFKSKSAANETVVLNNFLKIKIFIVILFAYIIGTLYGLKEKLYGSVLKNFV
jgi:GT2 family glycosyltransferase